MTASEIISIAVIVIVLMATCFMSYERSLESESLIAVIRSEVKAEMDRRYKNVPHISVNKVYTLQAGGEEMIMDVK